VVATERVTLPLLDPGVKVGGLKEQLLRDGSPEHAKEIALPNEPPTGAIAKV
jgi:hypothetical protein